MAAAALALTFAGSAAQPPPIVVKNDRAGVFSQVYVPGRAPKARVEAGAGGSPPTHCTFTRMNLFASVIQAIGKDDHLGQAGAYYLWTCGGGREELDWFAAARPPQAQLTAGQLARQAAGLLALPAPIPRMAPDRDPSPARFETVVNLPTRVWLDRTSWTARLHTTGVQGLAVTVTATPTDSVWDLGAGAKRCGAASCDYRITTPAAARAGTVAERWRIRWTATDGETGVLPAQTTQTPVTVTADEYAAALVG